MQHTYTKVGSCALSHMTGLPGCCKTAARVQTSGSRDRWDRADNVVQLKRIYLPHASRTRVPGNHYVCAGYRADPVLIRNVSHAFSNELWWFEAWWAARKRFHAYISDTLFDSDEYSIDSYAQS